MQALIVRNVWFKYAGRSEHVLRGVNMCLGRGELALITGGNGSGKTTLLKIISGLLTPEEGEVVINGVNVTGDPRKASGLVGMAFQNPMHQFTAQTVLNEVAESLRLKGVRNAVSKALKVLDRFNLTHLASRLPHTLSMGEARMLTIALASANRPAVLLLDEPFTGLDIVQVEGVAKVIKELRGGGASVVVTVLKRDLRIAQALLKPSKSLIIDGGVLKCLRV